MIQRKTKSISGSEQQMNLLKETADKLALSDSELIHLCIQKVAGDPIMQQILIKNFLDEKGNKLSRDRLLRIMSIKTNLKKESPHRINHRSDDKGTLSNVPQENDTNMKHMIEVAKYNLYPELKK